LLREAARERRVPVIMAFDIPQGTLVDVERYDVNPDLVPFHGILGPITSADVPPQTPLPELAKYVMQLYPPKYMSKRMMESIPLFGTELISPPQLGISAFFAGSAVARAILSVTLGEPIARRMYMSWDEKFSPDHDEIAI
jgi:hypothetical protein